MLPQRRQKTDLRRVRKHHDIEQSLRNTTKSARTVRDLMLGEIPSQDDSHEQVFFS